MRPVCLVTGASGRLGSAVSELLLQTHDIVAVYRHRVPELSSQLRSRIDPAAPTNEVYAVQCDLNRREDIRRLVEVALARFGRIDSVVNSAADLRFHGKLTELWEADGYAASQLDVNCIAPLMVASAIFQGSWKNQRHENAQWNRSIVNVSSMSALYVYGQDGQAFYGASKAALNMLTMHLALELAPYSIRANAICPGQFRDTSAARPFAEAIVNLIRGNKTGVVISKFPVT